MGQVEHQRTSEVWLAVGDRADCCPLGAWLRSPPRLSVELVAAELCEVARLHDAFHREAEAVAQMVAEGRFDEAQRALLPGSAYGSASDALMQALLVLVRRLEALVAPEAVETSTSSSP